MAKILFKDNFEYGKAKIRFDGGKVYEIKEEDQIKRWLNRGCEVVESFDGEVLPNPLTVEVKKETKKVVEKEAIVEETVVEEKIEEVSEEAPKPKKKAKKKRSLL